MVHRLPPKLAPEIIALIKTHGIQSAMSADNNRLTPVMIQSGISGLDELLGGGLATGGLSEWGMPIGQGSREVILRFIDHSTNAQRQVLWVNGQEDLTIYPTAWSARGVNLRRLRFVDTDKPLDCLKPVFLEPSFDLVVLDAPKRLGHDDWAFLSRQARLLQMHVMVLQNFFLSPKRGNVWARIRVNCTASSRRDSEAVPFSGWQLKVLRGGQQQVFRLASLDL